jgi:hypothetical protein
METRTLHALRSKFFSAAAALLFAAGLVACSASTAHIGSLQVAKDKDMTTPTTSFGLHDTVYAKADADNLPGKVTLNWQLIAENVKGQPPNSDIPSLHKSYDLDADGTTDYTLTPPDAGWPPGTYKIVLTMMDDGTQRDQKSAEVTVGP